MTQKLRAAVGAGRAELDHEPLRRPLAGDERGLRDHAGRAEAPTRDATGVKLKSARESVPRAGMK